MHIAGSGTDVAVEAADVVLIRFVYFDVVSSKTQRVVTLLKLIFPQE